VGRTLEGERIDGRLQWVAPVVAGRADLSRVLVAITDLTERRRAERELERRLALENLVAQLSTHFINLDSAATDRGIDQALEAIGRHAGAQRSYLFRLSESDNTITNTHEWCAPGVESMKDRIQHAPTAAFPWISAELLRGKTVLLRSLADLPAEAAAERAEFEAQGIVSLVNVPMISGSETVGFVGLDSLTITQMWSDADVQLLNLVGQMLLNALERKVTDERMAALMASKDQLVASVSHELRTPLTVVVGLVEELSNRMDLSDDDRADFVEVIRDQSHELTHIVEDLLVASRAGTGELAVSFEPVSLTRELESVLALLPRSDGRVPEVSGRAGLVRGDRLRIRQILRNLLSNALRYGGEHITVTLRDRTSTAEVIVADDGPGVPIGDRERVFEPFQRAHSTPGRPGSLGIGLAVSRQLARLMRGDLRFASEEGNAFVLDLPLDAAAAGGAPWSEAQDRPTLIDETDEPPTVPLLGSARADRER
jgi:signal transduction histidine kinase